MGYSKLHSSLVNSSLWCERDDVRLLFITLLALADYNGDVFGSWGGIARQANIHWPPDDGDPDPFQILMEPDADSSDILRNPENEGKRIEQIAGGFHIINYPFYRGLRNDDDRREQNRQAQAAYRKRNKPKSAEISRDKPQSAHAEAEAEEDKETRVHVSSNNWLNSDDLWIELQRILPESEVKKHVGLWISRIKENRNALYEAICDFKDKRNQRRIKNVGAWLTQRYQHFKKLLEDRAQIAQLSARLRDELKK